MHLVLFDMDHTLIPVDTGTVWAEFLQEKNLMSKEQVIQRSKFLQDYLNGTLDVKAAYRFDISILSELDYHRDELLLECFNKKILPKISHKAIDTVERHRANGDYVVMITATLEDMARPAAEFFGVDYLIGGKPEFDDNGKYTGDIAMGPCMGRGKLIHLEAWLTEMNLNPTEYTFYSDSHNDLPLLEQVDNPIAVDPDAKLREIAIENEWQVISFID